MVTKSRRPRDTFMKKTSDENQYLSILGYLKLFSESILNELSKEDRENGNKRDVASKAKKNVLRKLVMGYGGVGCRGRVGRAEALVDDVISARKAAGFSVYFYRVRLASQGLVGVGSGVFNAVFEVGLSWHPFLDVPYYPGSSIKGSVRSALEDLTEVTCKEGNKWKKCIELIERVFGCCSRESVGIGRSLGVIEFDDLLPVECGIHGKLLDSSIVTPHYFSGGKPVKWEYEASPTPILHLAIARGVVFKGIVSIRPGGEKLVLELAKELIGLQTKSLDEAISSMLAIAFEYGVGARSAKGYNVFELLDS